MPNPTIAMVVAGASLLVGAVSAGCDTPTLPAGATLSLSFEAAVLYPASSPSTPPADRQECVTAGGAVVDLRAWTPDGRPAKDVQVVLWLDPSVGAQLSSLGGSCGDAADDLCVRLDGGGEGHACLLPGMDYGTVTVVAHSGVIQQSKSISVTAHVLTPGSSLTVGVSSESLSSVLPDVATTCGSPAPMSCSPGQARSALVTLLAASPDGMPPPRDGTLVSLSVTGGWISTDDHCATSTERSPIANAELTNGIANATWCFGDTSATATLRAQSGSVSGTAIASVASIPASLFLSSSATGVASGGEATLSAVVTGCDGQGIADVPVLFRTTAGDAAIEPSTPVVTNTQGVATATATMATGATFVAAVAQAQEIECNVDVEVTP
jgi:hypothetical protein